MHLTARVATFATACLANLAASDERRDLLPALGGARLLLWLVHQACEDPSPVQVESERAVVSLLKDGELRMVRLLPIWQFVRTPRAAIASYSSYGLATYGRNAAISPAQRGSVQRLHG
jgi:hypothetical protein